MNVDHFKAHLEWAEARHRKPYTDSVGKLTIGIGRNLDDRGLSDAEIDFLRDNDIRDVLAIAATLPYWPQLNDARKLVVADMLFNLGLGRFLKFKLFGAALDRGDYDGAADEMVASKWYGQVGRRAVRIEKVMRTGIWPA